MYVYQEFMMRFVLWSFFPRQSNVSIGAAVWASWVRSNGGSFKASSMAPQNFGPSIPRLGVESYMAYITYNLP